MVNKTTIAGSIILVLGVIIAVGWFFAFPPVLSTESNKKLKDALIVDSPNAQGYDDWVSGTAQRNPNYYTFYLMNLTNAADMIATGAAPEYTQYVCNRDLYAHYYTTLSNNTTPCTTSHDANNYIL